MSETRVVGGADAPPTVRATSAVPGEPLFILGASDESFATFLRVWSDDRMAAIQSGKLPLTEVDSVIAARVLLVQAEKWREQLVAKNTFATAGVAYDIPAADPEPEKVPEPVPVAEKPVPKSIPKKAPPKKLEKAVAEAAAKAPMKSDAKPKAARVKLAK